MIQPGRRSLTIDGRSLGPEEPCYIVAEISGNHNQNFERALAIVKAAKDAGADAVKLQTYTPDTITLDCVGDEFQIHGTAWNGRRLHELYQEAQTPWDWHLRLKTAANELGLALFSSPFDLTAVDFLEKMGMPAYKIASCELVDLPLIRRAAKTGKPLILSTGMATLGEIEEAVSTARAAGKGSIALLKCTCAYPAPIGEMNLRTIAHLAQTFGVPVGLSDHSLGTEAPVAAVALGATIVEKHLTLSRSDAGPDSAFSLEPAEFKAMVAAVRSAEQALGRIEYGPTSTELASTRYRRSLFVVEDMRAGEAFDSANVRSIRPATGLHTRHLEAVLGRHARIDIKHGTPLRWDLVSE